MWLAPAMGRTMTLALLGIVLAAASGCVPGTRSADCDEPTATIELELSATTLTPDDPAACKDQELTVEVASEVDGFLHIHGYDEEVPAAEVSAGETLTLTFTAIRSGQFPIELHPADDPTGIGVGLLTVHEP